MKPGPGASGGGREMHRSRPGPAWVFARPERILAFGFGSGLLTPGPGTWGTLLGWALWVVLLEGLGTIPMVVLLVASFGVGCLAAQRCGQDLGVADHGGINWDEIVAIWLVLWLVPAGFWPQCTAVILFRAFDIVKPPPVNWLDARFKNGFGVMVDDLVAALYAILTMAVLVHFGVFA
ncbi:phosphatidylglycerophosphatase A [Castellaniella sp.]|uniref:phosphatidylglycerophosphatase A family protein n=1 Tax=Castellaniella sp. TaxID=1955812 RepID=UPI0035635039